MLVSCWLNRDFSGSNDNLWVAQPRKMGDGNGFALCDSGHEGRRLIGQSLFRYYVLGVSRES